MLKLSDFQHLPQLDPLFERMVASGPGLLLLSGVDARPASGLPGGFLPSGLSAVFDGLWSAMLGAQPLSSAVLVSADKRPARVPRSLRGRVKALALEYGQTLERQIRYAVSLQPDLLVVDCLNADSAAAVFAAAERGVRVVSTCDSPLRGAALARRLLSFGVAAEQLHCLTWIVSLQRLPALCPACRRVYSPRPAELERLARRFPALAGARAAAEIPGPVFWQPGGCERCRGSGRSGDVAVFDVFDARSPQGDGTVLDLDSLLPAEEYMYHLACQGLLCLDDIGWFESGQLERAYQLLSASGQALDETAFALRRKVAELEASNRVLQQRTAVLLSLEDLSRALIESADLTELAQAVCRRAGELCGADRAVFYLLRWQADAAHSWGSQQAEVLAARGWDSGAFRSPLEALDLFEGTVPYKLVSYTGLPPGLREGGEPADGPARAIRTGLRVPLLAQERLVGVMILQSSQKNAFTPGESALLQAFANQAALAVQRAGLVDELRGKIQELENAQAGLVKKERLERELELAREVQQRLLPRHFPRLPGFGVAARSLPARQVGGDFYDVIALSEDSFGVVIADVSDKGMPAALYMGLARSLLLAEAPRSPSPRRVLENVNRLLLELGELDGFVSVFYGVVRLSTRVLRYVRAGHEKPWLLRPGSEPLVLGGQGMVLGAFDSDQLRLSEEELALASGDRLVLYTDGLTDTAAPDGGFFGAQRLEAALREQASLPAEALLAAILERLEAFRGSAEPFDDRTLLVLEVN